MRVPLRKEVSDSSSASASTLGEDQNLAHQLDQDKTTRCGFFGRLQNLLWRQSAPSTQAGASTRPPDQGVPPPPYTATTAEEQQQEKNAGEGARPQSQPLRDAKAARQELHRSLVQARLATDSIAAMLADITAVARHKPSNNEMLANWVARMAIFINTIQAIFALADALCLGENEERISHHSKAMLSKARTAVDAARNANPYRGRSNAEDKFIYAAWDATSGVDFSRPGRLTSLASVAMCAKDCLKQMLASVNSVCCAVNRGSWLPIGDAPKDTISNEAYARVEKAVKDAICALAWAVASVSAAAAAETARASQTLAEEAVADAQ